MEFKEVLAKRRSIRAYKKDSVPNEMIKALINDAILAPSAMNSQPWSFVVISGVKRLMGLSEKVKTYLLSNLDKFPWLARYQEMLSNKEYNIFYNAPALIIICSKPAGPSPDADCCLAAENLILSAVNNGLGTCWIGFSFMFLNIPEAKKEFGISDDYRVIAPLIVGYPDENPEPREREKPEIMFWE
jgi:nitroreductase